MSDIDEIICGLEDKVAKLKAQLKRSRAKAKQSRSRCDGLEAGLSEVLTGIDYRPAFQIKVMLRALIPGKAGR